ncbi:LysR substrate-binding domain-containing protein [Sphingomonas sp.]|uniref:LysR substrate-binding domain-containing protein n=1 Tax=Sphingomonas sp. TaxID=28214 RepID=UPI003AFFA1D4
MMRGSLDDLAAFAVIARERGFTPAAAKLGVSPSALSHAMRGLEERLGTRLLARTTRSVAPTEAGERLLLSLGPALAGIEAGLIELRDARETPSGTVRVTAVKHAVQTLLMPMLPAFTAAFPDIRLEIDVDDRFVDIVAGGYDAGIRFAGSVERDMIAVGVGAELRTAVVAAPAYLRAHTHPSSPRDLADHRCIVHRRADGDIYPWPFRGKGRIQQVRVEGAVLFNDGDLVLASALAGQGLACVFEDRAAPFIADGLLVRLLERWTVAGQRYALYYAGRRQNPPALARFIEAVRSLPG